MTISKEVSLLFRRNLLGVIATGGIVAAIGYMLIPKRRSRFSFNMNRWPLSLRDVTRMSRMLMRGFAR